MKKSYLKNQLYIAMPSKLDENDSNILVQNPKDITVLHLNEENKFIDLTDNQEVVFFEIFKLDANKKYIDVFRNDCDLFVNYIYSFKTDNLEVTDTFRKILFDNKNYFTEENIKFIIEFLKSESANYYYLRTKKIKKGKRRIRKK